MNVLIIQFECFNCIFCILLILFFFKHFHTHPTNLFCRPVRSDTRCKWHHNLKSFNKTTHLSKSRQHQPNKQVQKLEKGSTPLTLDSLQQRWPSSNVQAQAGWPETWLMLYWDLLLTHGECLTDLENVTEEVLGWCTIR